MHLPASELDLPETTSDMEQGVATDSAGYSERFNFANRPSSCVRESVYMKERQ